MKSLIRPILALFILLISMPSFAQLEELGNVPTPTATQLGKFGDVPVSYYTGRAGISIPLYSTTLHGIPLDVSLSYDSGGVPVNQIPGLVGECWTLNAGGVITRSQDGGEDEYTSYPYNTVQYKNYFHNYDFVPRHLEDIQNDSLWYTGCTPNIYHFNFMGMSGRFFLGNDGEWKVASNSNLDVVFDIDDPSNYIYPLIDHYPSNQTIPEPKCIKGFTLLDENGNQYKFGGDTNSIEFSIDFFNARNYEVSSHVTEAELNNLNHLTARSWYLTEVMDRNGNVVYEFSYVRGKMLAQLFRSSYYWKVRHGSYTGSVESWADVTTDYQGTLNMPAYLNRVKTSDNTYIYFHRTPAFSSGETGKTLYPSIYSGNNAIGVNQQMQALGRLTGPGTQYRAFYYLQTTDEPFASMQDESTNKILDPLSSTSIELLNNVSIHLGTSMSTDSLWYEFSYDTSTRPHLTNVTYRGCSNNTSYTAYNYSLSYFCYDMLPTDYLTPNSDHWGYYSESGSTIRLDTLNYRKPDPISTRYGALTEISYPTKGKTKLTYEQNTYNHYMNFATGTMTQVSTMADKNGGGLRVRTIEEYDRKGNFLKGRTFTYKTSDGILGSGQLYANPKYFWTWHTKDELGYDVTEFMYRSTPVIPLINSFGPTLGYSLVTETYSDGSSTTYNYSNFSDACDTGLEYSAMESSEISPYEGVCNRSYRRGRLLRVDEKSSDGTTFKTSQYNYRTDNCESDFVWTSNVNKTDPISYMNNSYWTGGFYKLFYPKYDVVRSIVSTRNGSTNVNDTTTYSMQDFKNLSVSHTYSHKANVRKCLSETLSRKGMSKTTSYTYPFIADTAFRNKFFLPATVVTEYHDGQQVKKTQTDYSQVGNMLLPHYEIVTVGPSGTPDTLVVYMSYTSDGLPCTYKEKGRYTTLLLWNRNDQMFARICCPYDFSEISFDNSFFELPQDHEILNNPNIYNPPGIVSQHIKEFQELTDTIPENPKECIMYKGKSLFEWPLVDATMYTYNCKGQLVAVTTGNGTTTYYYYDVFNRLFEEKDNERKKVKSYNYHYSGTSNY